MLDIEGLNQFFDQHFTRSAFRLETLDKYTVESDAGNFERYIRGGPEPSMEVKAPWQAELERYRAEGKRWQRVHVVKSPLSDYLRYECEWGYAKNAPFGDEVHILDIAEIERPAGLVDEDFWLLDDKHVLKMNYDDEGRFIGAEEAQESKLQRYRRQRELALERAVPFEEYWAAHPEYWRENWLGKSGGDDPEGS